MGRKNTKSSPVDCFPVVVVLRNGRLFYQLLHHVDDALGALQQILAGDGIGGAGVVQSGQQVLVILGLPGMWMSLPALMEPEARAAGYLAWMPARADTTQSVITKPWKPHSSRRQSIIKSRRWEVCSR